MSEGGNACKLHSGLFPDLRCDFLFDYELLKKSNYMASATTPSRIPTLPDHRFWVDMPISGSAAQEEGLDILVWDLEKFHVRL